MIFGKNCEEKMIYKEFRDILKPTLVGLSLLLVIPILAIFKVPIKGIFYFITISVYKIFNSPPENVYVLSFILLLGITIFWIGNISLGSHIFHTEYKDNAFEYLLASPYTKSQILFYKVLNDVQ